MLAKRSIQSIITNNRNHNSTWYSIFCKICNGKRTPKSETAHKKIKNFTRFINQHIKKICKKNDLPEISTYWARHSYSTQAIKNGASLEMIKETLGHSNIKTTQNYFAGFDDKTIIEVTNSIMNFD